MPPPYLCILSIVYSLICWILAWRHFWMTSLYILVWCRNTLHYLKRYWCTFCKGLPLIMKCDVLIMQTTQVNTQSLHVGAGMVFGIMKQCNFCCISVLGNWKNLETFSLTHDPLAAKHLQLVLGASFLFAISLFIVQFQKSSFQCSLAVHHFTWYLQNDFLKCKQLGK